MNEATNRQRGASSSDEDTRKLQLYLDASTRQAKLESQKSLNPAPTRRGSTEESLEHASEGFNLVETQAELLSVQLQLAAVTEERDAWRDYVLALRRNQRGSELEAFRDLGERIPQAVVTPLKKSPSEAPDSEERSTRVERPRVQIVVCVFNALSDVRLCLESLASHQTPDVEVLVVDDASDAETRSFLESWVREHSQSSRLLSHRVNRGYTASVNTGLAASASEFVVLLNSDTIVTAGWLERMVACAQSDTSLGIVGPLSNAASWQNVPSLLDDDGKFAVNEIPSGHTLESFASLVAKASTLSRPRVPFINGFCFLIRREVIEKIGEFDLDSFPRGYGEENDYCLRAADAGFQFAIADDAYVFHSKSKSFGHSQRVELSQLGKEALEAKHGHERVKSLVKKIKAEPGLDSVRNRIDAELSQSLPIDGESGAESVSIENAVRNERVPPVVGTERILFLLPVAGGGGGAHSVVQEATAMRRLGTQADVAVPVQYQKKFLKEYQSIPEVHDLFVPFRPQEVLELAAPYTVVVGTIFSSIKLLRKICAAHPEIVPFYYVQDYEPNFFPPGTALNQEALDSYSLIPGATLFAKTWWLVDTIREKHGVSVHKVNPSLDHSVYRTTKKGNGDTLVVAAMIRPSTPRRGPRRTLNVLRRVKQLHPNKVSIQIFGCDPDDPDFSALRGIVDCKNLGKLNREQVSKLLSTSDIFIDLSDYQAFGRTGLEAMACGCAVINPQLGGADEYCVDGENSLLVDTSSETECVEALLRLVENDSLRKKLADNGEKVAMTYSPERAARSELSVILSGATKFRNEPASNRACRIRGLISEQRLGAPAGSAYVRVLQPYQSSYFASRFFSLAKVSEFQQEGKTPLCETLLIQRDVLSSMKEATKVVKNCKDASIRIVYEVDDLFLDRTGLEERRYPGNAKTMPEVSRYITSNADAVIVSSGALAKAYRRLNKHVSVVPNGLDNTLWKLGEPKPKGSFVKRPGDPIRIGFVGTRSHSNDIDLIRPALIQLAEEYGDSIRFELIGGYKKGAGDSPPPFHKISLVKDASYPNFVEWIRKRCNWDIGLIPLVDDDFNRSKSYIKWLEYSALGLASVCTDIDPYREVVRNGENGLLVENTTEAWVQALRRLIDDASLRDRMAAKALSDVKEAHTLQETVPKILQVLDDVAMRPVTTLRKLGGEVSRGQKGAASPASEVSSLSQRRRKLKKLFQNPQKFLKDSKFPMAKKVGNSSLLWR